MAFEKLTLEVGARTSGLNMVTPPVLKGKADVEHRFTTLASDGTHFFAFDIYDTVTEIEVMRSYAKEFDTGATTQIVCLGSSPTEEARHLAAEYNMEILGSESLPALFKLHAVAQIGS